MIKITDRPKWADVPLPKMLQGIVIDLGCSYQHRNNISKSYFSIDINKDTRPMIIADIENMPIKDNIIDNIICNSLLEHVQSPIKVVSECKRILKNKGRMYVATPFMYYEHDSCDYQRYSMSGLKYLLREFKIISITRIADGFCRTHITWILPLTYIFSKRLRNYLQHILHFVYLIVSPIDIGKGRFYSGIYCIAEKKERV